MKFNLGPIREWFGFTRRERRSSLILLILIAGIIFVRYAMPLSVTELKEVSAGSWTKGDTVRSDVITFRVQADTGKSKSNNRKNQQSGRYKEFNSVKDSDSRRFTGYNARVYNSHKREKTELNSCDSAALDLLPGIGPVLSSRIVKYRNLLGGFYSTEQLKEVYGLDSETVVLIKPRLSIDTMKIFRINVNTAAYRELARHPYIGRVDASAMLKYRDLEGQVKSIDELVRNRILIVEKRERLSHYLVFE